MLTIRSVEISGYSIAVNRTGAAEATVVLESGCGNDHSTWSDLQRALSGQASVVSYDRPGAGQSDRPCLAWPIAGQRYCGQRARTFPVAGVNGRPVGNGASRERATGSRTE